ncbi:hypothetical protein BSPWISOXPB_4311, partial [uncultured Gammaproteobacteria bacterium]
KKPWLSFRVFSQQMSRPRRLIIIKTVKCRDYIHMNFLNLSTTEKQQQTITLKKRSAEAEKEIVVLSNKATRLLEESVKSTKEIALLKAETVKLEKEISEIKKTSLWFFSRSALHSPTRKVWIWKVILYTKSLH